MLQSNSQTAIWGIVLGPMGLTLQWLLAILENLVPQPCNAMYSYIYKLK